MIFRPERAEDISSVYLLNQIFESVSDLFAKEIFKKWYDPNLYNCLCVYFFMSINKKIAHCYFSIDKIKNKKPHRAYQFLDVLLKTYLIFLGLITGFTFLIEKENRFKDVSTASAVIPIHLPKLYCQSSNLYSV